MHYLNKTYTTRCFIGCQISKFSIQRIYILSHKEIHINSITEHSLYFKATLKLGTRENSASVFD